MAQNTKQPAQRKAAPASKAKAQAPTGAPAAPESTEGRVTKIGTVDSDARTKTRRVVVSFLTKHPKYGKYVRQRTVLHVHDEREESKRGDVVEVTPCRPVSKTKTWKLVRIVERRSEEAAALRSVKELQA